LDRASYIAIEMVSLLLWVVWDYIIFSRATVIGSIHIYNT